MAVEGPAEQAVFFDPEDFGSSATWTVAATPFEVDGIYNDPHLEVAELDTLGVSSTGPEFVCALAAVPAGAAQGDPIVIAGINFEVIDIRRSGNGLARVDLRQV